jgi:hypothetical protein
MTLPDTSVPLPGAGPSPSPAAIPLPGPPGGKTDLADAPVPEAGRPKEASAAATPPRRRFELFVRALVLLLAFLAASFAIRNADFWLHLAGGRLLAEGRWSFGVDPFSYTAGQTYWANHAWLYDLLLYDLYGLVGGAGLVILKALLVTALAGLMLLVRRQGEAGWISAVCTALAVVVMSPRLLLQPACLSCFFLGLTLWLLWRAEARTAPVLPSPLGGEGSGVRGRLRHYLFLPLLFAVWVNVDDWFWLGPLLAGLFWVGGRIRGDARTPGWVAPLGLAACLANPYGYRAFTLPAELSPVLWQSGLLEDVRFHRLFASPWQLDLLSATASGVNLARWAYFLLVGLGLASFVVGRRNLAGWRLPVWLVFGLLGAWQARLVPFFAVVAGPITALNLQEALAALPRAARASWVDALGRWALVAGGLGLVALAWLGCLQGWNSGSRRVCWGVQPDPSLQRIAETLRQTWKEGDRVFAFHPDVVYYCAWLCPEVKGFFDHRLPLFPEAARDYAAACRELIPGLGRKRDPAPLDGQEVFRKWAVTHLVLYDPDPHILRAGVTQRDWVLLRVDGEALLYARRQSKPQARNDQQNKPEAQAKDQNKPEAQAKDAQEASERFDAERLAFGPLGEEEESALPPAPGKGPGRGPRPSRWWAHHGRPEPLPAWESAAANVFLQLFLDSYLAEQQKNWAKSWRGYLAGLVGLAAGPASPLAASGAIGLRLGYAPLFLAGVGDQPPALPLLAVRAARRALAANPDDANAYLRLAQAYFALRDETAEHSREGRLPPLAMLRHVQIATALEHALVLNPDLEVAHQHLAALYAQRQFLDAALEHRRAQLALVRRSKPQPGEPAEAFAHRLAQLEDQVLELETLVGERENAFGLRAASLRDNPLARAQLALDLGLARKALDDILLKSRVLLFGTGGARLELELLLLLGRAEEVRDLLDDEEMQQNRHTLGLTEIPGIDPSGRLTLERLPAYEWFLCCRAAASGDYDRAAAALQAILDPMHAEIRKNLPFLPRTLPIVLGTDLGTTASLPGSGLLPHLVGAIREQTAEKLVQTYRLQAEAADLHVLAVMLDLERGLPAAARRHLEQAQALCPPGSPSQAYADGRALALACRRWLASAEGRAGQR